MENGLKIMKPGAICGLLLSVVLFCGISMAEDIPHSAGTDVKTAIEAIRSISPGDFNLKWDERRDAIRFISGRLTRPSTVPAEKIAMDFISRYKALFGVRDNEKELSLDRTDTTPKGHIIHFKQRKDGLDVIGGKITVRVDKGVIMTVANHFEPNIPVTTTPIISRDEAISIGKSAVKLTDLAPDTKLVILPWDEKFYLSYRLDFPFTDKPKPSRYRVYVDATEGAVMMIENRVMHNGPAVGTGNGIDGTLKTFDTYEISGKFYLGNQPVPGKDVKIKTYTTNNTKTLPGSIMKDADNYWQDPAAIDAHFYGNYVFDFYGDNFSNFTWYAGSGFQKSGGLISTVHYDTAYDNAFWNGEQMVYGDGDVIFHPLSGALDVVAHEITHGVTEAINNLTYCKESGALNESWSDVMGMFAAIDFGDDLPYQIGEEIMKIDETPGYEAYYAMRRMDDPSFRTDGYSKNDYNPNDPLNGWGQPEHTSEQYIAGCWPWTDNGGVHINSGIPNKAAYLITVHIGADKAKQIYYLAMFYLSSNSTFTVARDAVEQATIDLYGAGPVLAAVQGAFDAVGIQ